ncbi:MAG: hypothetical protein P9M08_12155 [Candidatus Erginobacter occultus]|nr:hypothetical protein [Candidatus Erginobacter occultus]
MRRFKGRLAPVLFLLPALLAGGTPSPAAERLLERSGELARAAEEEGRTVVEGRDGWLFLVSELRHLAAGPFWGEAARTASRAKRAEARDPLPAILDFHRELKAKGIELILVPVPAKAAVYPHYLPGDPGAESGVRPDPHHREFYSLLRAEGVKVLDLTDRFREGPDPARGPYYCRQDSHWSGTGCVRAAEILADKVRPLLPRTTERSYPAAWKEIEIDGDLRRMLDDPGVPPEILAVRAVEGETLDPDSPLLVLGDSHTLVFHAGGDMHTRGAGLADQLARELGRPVELVGVRGSGATPARLNLFRKARGDPEYWNRKRAVVWIFSAREFTESDGWRLVPLGP